VEVDKLVSSIEETLSFLQNSKSSDWAHMSVEEIITRPETEISKAKNLQPMDAKFLSLLFAPTGAIQETANDNGWGNDFLRISEVIEKILSEE
jgi:hypothetical protein